MASDSLGKVTLMSKDGGLPGTMTYVQYMTQGQDQIVFAYLVNTRPGPTAKRSCDVKAQFQTPITDFIARLAGQWPATGDLFNP